MDSQLKISKIEKTKYITSLPLIYVHAVHDGYKNTQYIEMVYFLKKSNV